MAGPVGSAIRIWVAAARPRTLTAAVTPVLVGTAAAEAFSAPRFSGALTVALALQVGVNFANDYFDGVKGVDTQERVGPQRAVAAGLIAARSMRSAMVAALGVAVLVGLALTAVVGWELLVVGVLSILAAVGYSGGPRPYASAALGELFVFVFFGLVATVGSTYVQDERVTALSVAAAVPVGLLAVAILVVNNLRDIRTDEIAGKRTLAVRMGDRGTRVLYVALILGAFASLGLVAMAAGSPRPALAVFLLPAATLGARPVLRNATGTDLLPALAGTALLQLVVGVALAVLLALP